MVAERMSLGARVATTIRAGRTVKVMRAVMVRRMVPPRDDTNPQSDVRHMETGCWTYGDHVEIKVWIAWAVRRQSR